MNHVFRVFFKGLITLLPLLLSVYVIFWLFRWVEAFASSTLLFFWPAFLYVPGMGILVVFLLIYAFGTVVDQPFTKWVFQQIEASLEHVPLMKSVYVAIKDLSAFLSPGGATKADRVVAVRFPGTEAELMGFVTRDDLEGLPRGIEKEARVAVYFPMSYQIGGYTLFLPKAWIRPVDMTVEDGMRNVLTAWLPGAADKLKNDMAQRQPK